MKRYLIIFLMIALITVIVPGCREYDNKLDIGYFFKTGPEKAVLDFLQSMENRDPGYIYSNLLQNKDKNKISREKYVSEFNEILEDVKDIEIRRTVYLGYEGNLSKVVAEFRVTYQNGEQKEYKKYIYLVEENNKWKIVFEKTFI
ncbi:MAG: NTF2-like N-terminal transpeptidase domain-containing protein [Candidatus Humimicrobiaceae bacterium]